MAKRSLTATAIAPDDAGDYDSLAERYGCFFDRVAWTSLWGDALTRVGIYGAGGHLRGGFCVAERRKFGLRILRNPPYTPRIGPFFEYRTTNPAARTSEHRDVQEAMAAFSSSRGAAVVTLGLSLGTTDCLPFYWRGFKVVPRYTYRIGLRREAGEVLSGMSVDRRNDVTKAEHDGIEVTEMRDVEHLRSLVMDTYARQHKAFPVDEMDRVLSAFPPGASSFGFLAASGGRPMVAVYTVHDKETAFCLLTGYCSSGAHRGAGALAMVKTILKAQEMGLATFDFEGSVIPPIEKYYRGFGGTLTPYFSVNKAWLPIEMLLKIRYRERF